MAFRIDGFAERLCLERVAVNADVKAAKQHPAGRDLEHKGVQPFHQQRFIVGRGATNIHSRLWRNPIQFGDGCNQRVGSLLEGRLLAVADAAHADVRDVGKMLPLVGCAVIMSHPTRPFFQIRSTK